MIIIITLLYSANIIWRSPSLSELTPMLFKKGLTHLASEASKSTIANIESLIMFISELERLENSRHTTNLQSAKQIDLNKIKLT